MLPQWLAATRQNGGRFALALVDLDDFKVINDTHGHQVGDRVLVSAAHLFKVALRMGQLPPANEYLAGGETRHVSFTFSAGLTEFRGADTPESIVRRADEALYDAKRRGKHCIETSGASFLGRLLT